MSIATDLKQYADAAVETSRSALNEGITQGRTALNDGLTNTREVVDESIDTAAKRVNALTGSAAERRAAFAEDARKAVLAALGAGDLAVAALRKRTQAIPGELQTSVSKAQETVSKAQESAKEFASTVQSRMFGLASKAGDVVDTAQGTVGDLRTGDTRSKVRASVEDYNKQLRETRDDLAERGEKVVETLREDPRLGKVYELAEQASDTVIKAAAYPARRRAGEKAAQTRVHNERSARGKKAAATRARNDAAATPATPRKTARKTTARRTTAGKTTATASTES